MKKVISFFLVLFITAGMLASCARMRPKTGAQTPPAADDTAKTAAASATEPVSAAETTSTDTTAETPTTYAPLVLTRAKPFRPADRLEPTQADLDRLAALLDWGQFLYKDYHSETDPVLDWIWFAVHMGMEQYDLLREGENYMHMCGRADENELPFNKNEKDPRGLFGISYKRIRADVMEYYLENVFHNTAYKTARESVRRAGADDTYRYGYYYQDGWYYFSCEHTGKDEGLQTRAYQLQPNGHYTVTIDEISWFDENDPPEPLATMQVDAALTQKDGRRLWTVYGTKVTYRQTYN